MGSGDVPSMCGGRRNADALVWPSFLLFFLFLYLSYHWMMMLLVEVGVAVGPDRAGLMDPKSSHPHVKTETSTAPSPSLQSFDLVNLGTRVSGMDNNRAGYVAVVLRWIWRRWPD